MATELLIHLPKPHERQRAFIDSKAKRKVVKAGRRGGKTVGVGILAVENFLRGRRVLYAAPTQDQIDRFWETVKRALEAPIDESVFRKNETRHIIELAGTEQRIRAKTAWNADTLRGDYADLLILDEFQLMDETAWNEVGAPMMIDTNGDAVFVYTPPSSQTRSVSKARDKRHAAKLFERAKQDTTGRWETFHFSSFDNPHLSHDALNDISQDMSALAYRQEILAEDIDEVPGALWTRSIVETTRVAEAPTLSRIIVAIDPAVTATSSSDETGIIVAGRDENDHGYILEDLTVKSSPDTWGKIAVRAYDRWQADMIVGETNNGGDMVGLVIRAAAKDLCDEGARETKIVPYKQVRASRGKRTRAEPISTLYEQKRVHHVGSFPDLEDQLCTWVPGDASPDRLDAMVWAVSELTLNVQRKPRSYQG